MLEWITLGFLMGLQHAFEADHIAAVASLCSSRTGLWRLVRQGAVWGIGHALSLSLFGGAVYLLKLSLTEQLSGILEFAVGAMLVYLGGRILYRMIHDRIHFHVHRHGNGSAHFHAHSHLGDVRDHKRSRHEHLHFGNPWRRSLAVGMMHGLAGSAALVALTASTAGTPTLGILFMVLFGVGSIFGMAAFSAALAVPLTFTAGSLTWANRMLQASAGLVAFGFGLHIMVENGAALAAGF